MKQYDAFRFIGGVDVNTPYLSRSPGSLRQALNYEPDPDGGYRLMPGYERFDGQQSPTDTVVMAVPVVSVFVTPPAVGTVITGANSGATGIYIDQDATQNYVYIANVSGTFGTSESLGSGVVTNGESYDSSLVLENGTADTLYQTAREYNRNQISEVPGSGAVRTVFELNDNIYAIRDNAGATAAEIYQATSSGWELVDTSSNQLLQFDAGTAGSIDPFNIEDTVTGATSGATGVVTGVANQSTDRQSGYITLKSVTGTFQDDELLQVNGTTQATANGAAQAISLSAGGDYNFVKYNFFGFESTESIYFVNGIQTAFQFDGVALAPIITSVSDDMPIEVAVHHDHLFLAFRHGRLAHSVVLEPLHWRGDLGAAVFALGSAITNMIDSPLSLIISTVDNVQVLYGSGIDDWNKTILSRKTIGIKGSGEYLIEPLVVDTSGLIALTKVDAFGNYQDAMVSDTIRETWTRLAPSITNAAVNRSRNNYYAFTNTGENILAGFSNNQFIGYFPFNLDRNVSSVVSYGERMFFTDDSTGFVFEWYKGTSHDGAARISYLQTSYAFQQEPQRKKRYRRVTISLKAFISVSLNIAFSFNKGSGATNDSNFIGNAIGGGGRWDIDNWNQILWDGQDIPEIISDIDGVGTDISMFLYSESSELPSFVLEDIVIEYSPRAIKR